LSNGCVVAGLLSNLVPSMKRWVMGLYNHLLKAGGVLAMSLCLVTSVRADISPTQFEEVAVAAGITDVGRSWSSAWGDFDGDGWPDVWLVNHQDPVSLYVNLGDGTFTNIAPLIGDSGFQDIYDAHGAAWADFDNDGDDDIVQLTDEGIGPIPSRMFVNTDGQLVDSATELGLGYVLGRGRMPLWLDYDRDGMLDVIFPTLRRGDIPPTDGPTALFRQTTSGFMDVSDQVGLVPNDSQNAHFALFADVTGDGVFELLINQNGFPRTIYDTTVEPFVDIRNSLGIPITFKSKDAVVADLDGDLDNDIFMVSGETLQGIVQVNANTVESHLQGNGTDQGISFQTSGDVSFEIYPKFVWQAEDIFIGGTGFNPESESFTLSPSDTLVWGSPEHTPGDDWGVYISYDPAIEEWQVVHSVNISNMVIVSTSVITELLAVGWDPTEPPPLDRLLINEPSGFVDSPLSGNLIPSSGRSVVAGDFDNDMDLDLYVVSTGPVDNWPNILYENMGGGSFVVTPSAGGAAGTSLGRGDGVTVADYDRNGFLDLLVTNGVSKPPFDEDGPTSLFQNQGNGNNWFEIDLVGTSSNRDGNGSQIVALAGGITQIRETGAGVHYRGQSHKRVHFGLGSNTTVDELTIHWPSGIVQIVTNIPSNQIIQVVETDISGVLPGQDLIPKSVQMVACFPNPFNPSTNITFTLGVEQPVTLTIHDVAGRLVRTLASRKVFQVGENAVAWNGKNDEGGLASSGIYLMRLEAGAELVVRKMVMLK
jgi:hypothetical protein